MRSALRPWRKLKNTTSDPSGYSQHYYYGVPQKRQKAIWVGSKLGEPLGGVSFCRVKVANPEGEVTAPTQSDKN
ncbi:hypothetical protein OGM63_02560 [Plectonema radiosum NIES-515]|uniref:Uncharacterized protein n=1 Tax=Plectonema radiosum NIES-515 TaxID=2986073 RepID=A0ABT3ATI3_9CYAN|nr:hypothetical protein [Plectonema radiosum]MCV3212422.1 hypothetical protein [Plectonema radiosum NIES-515]